MSTRQSKKGSLFSHLSFFPKLSFSHKRSRWPLLLALLFLLVTIPTTFYLNSRAKPVAATWWNASWQYRQRVDITNASGSELTDFQVGFSLDTATLITAGKLQANCQDIRVTDHQGNELPFWIETAAQKCNTATTKVWVKASKIPSTGATFFVYYGNSSAAISPNHDGEKVFEYFEGFETYPLSSNINGQGSWNVTTGTWTIASDPSNTANKVLSANTNGGSWWQHGIKDSSFTTHNNVFLEADFYIDGAYSMYTTDPLMWIGFRNSSDTAYTSPGWGGWNDYHVIASIPTSERATDNVNISTIPTSQWIPFKVSAFGTTITSHLVGGGTISWSGSTQTTGTFLTIDLRALKGYWDNLRSRKYAATEPAVTFASEETTPGPVVELKFDEGGGTQAKDSSGFGNHATVPSSTQWKDESECISGKCLFMDSTSDVISIANNRTLNNTKQLSLSFWWKPMAFHTGYAYQIINKFSGTENANLALYYFGDYNGTYPQNSGKFMMYANAGGTWKGISNQYAFTQAELGQWHHIAFSYDSVLGGQLYIDGKPVSGRVSSGDLAINTNDLRIGLGSMAQYYDEFRLYPYAITQEQVLKDYNRGSAVMIGAQEQGVLSDKLVGYWKMDETSWNGTTGEIVDTSGFSKNATSRNGAQTVVGKFGFGATFDGIDDYLEIPDSNDFDIGEAEKTISFWIKANPQAGTKFLLDHYNGGTPGSGWHFTLSQYGMIGFSHRATTDTISLSSQIVIHDNQWHHVAVSVKEGTARLFIDGKYERSDTYSGLVDHDETLKIGGLLPYTEYYYTGQLDEVRIYSRALAADEIATLSNYAPGPMAYWKLDEGSGSTANDNSGNGKTGTLISNPTWQLGKFGHSLNFSNPSGEIGSYLRSACLNLPRITGSAITASFWVKPNSSQPSGNAPLLIYTPTFAIDIAKNAPFVVDFRPLSGGTTYRAGFTQTINANTWTHVSVVLTQNQQVQLYINGVLKETKTFNYITDACATYFIVGGHNGAYNGFQGQMDEVKIYNYARTSQQIVQDMNGGHPTGGSPIGSQLAYFPFDEGTGTTAHDTISNTYNGTLMCSGTSCTIPTWKNDGRVNKAIYFSAVSGDRGDFVRAPAINLGTTLGDKLTVSAWIKPISTETNYGWIIRNGHSMDENYSLKLVSQSGGKWNVGVEYYDTTFRNIAGTQYVVPNNVWSHIAVVYSQGQNVKIYLNGQYIEQVAWTGSPSVAATTYFNIGGHAGTINQFFGGYIDEVKVYNSELTADQIKLDYNLGTANSYGGSAVHEGTNLVDGSGNPPTAEYHFEEMTGTQALDTSGNNLNGVITGAQWTPQGKESAALSFDGSNYVTVTAGSSLDARQNFSVCSWAKANNTANNVIAGKGRDTTNTYSYLLQLTYSGKPRWWLYNGSSNPSISATTTTVAGVWYYVCGTYDGANMKIYVNGKMEGQRASTIDPGVNTSNFIIGAWPNQPSSTERMNGFIDELKVYSYARTPAQIAYDYNRGKPVAHWKLDECQGDTVYDMGSDNNGTLVVGASGTQTAIGTCTTSGTAWGNGATGKFESSLNFDGTDDYVNIPGPATDLQITGAITISSWVKTTKADYQIVLDDLGAPPYTSWTQWLDPSGKISWYNGSAWLTSSTAVNDGVWHHIVTVVDDANTLSFYIDGKKDANTYSSVPARTATTDAKAIGRRADTNTYMFNGQIDDVRVYNYALSETQIKQVLNEGMAVMFDN